MNDDRILEFMAHMGDYMRSTDQRFEQMNRNFERVITVMHDGFGRITDQLQGLNNRVDHLTERVDHLTVEVRELKDDVRVLKDDMSEVKRDIRDIKAEAQITNRRLGATFDQAGHLTEENTVKETRIIKLETDHAEMQQRLSAVEEFMRRAS